MAKRRRKTGSRGRHRRASTGWFLDPDDPTPKVTRGGQTRCRFCKAAVPSGRRSFCGAACAHHWRIHTHNGYRRKWVWLRDGGVCALCEVDTVSLFAAAVDQYQALAGDPADLFIDFNGPTWRMLCEHFGMPPGRETWWDADHITPLSEGGSNGLGNMRTLCCRCHKAETAALRARLAVTRAKIKVKARTRKAG